MKHSITITFDLPPKALRPNDGHRAMWSVAAARQKAREVGRLLTVQALGRAGLQALTPKTYSVVWYYRKGVGPDDDNVLASIKSYKDGMCDALCINDRGLELVRILRIPSSAARVELTMSEATWVEAVREILMWLGGGV